MSRAQGWIDEYAGHERGDSTSTMERIVLALAAAYGDPRETGPYHLTWYVGLHEITFNRFQDGSFRVAHYNSATSGYSEWNSYEATDKLATKVKLS